jgi:nicotinamidase/pyrazinamidase
MVRGIANSKIGFGDLILLLRYFFKLKVSTHTNQLAQKFEHIVLTQDWHPDQHISFADNHPNKKPFETIELDYGRQVLWPKHCVQGTRDAEFHPHLNIPTAQLIIRKGCHQNIDSYSAFMEADRKTDRKSVV